jgi:hypothetical protein
MDGCESSDGTYTATVAPCTADHVTFLAPACEPTVLIASAKTLPQTEQTELSSGESVQITIAEGTIIGLEDGTE